MGSQLNFRSAIKQLSESGNPKAILLGNGINLYFRIGESWNKLLVTLYDKYLRNQNNNMDLNQNYFKNFDISYTEFFDLLESRNLYNVESKEQDKKTYELKRFLQYKISNWSLDSKIIDKYNLFFKSCLDNNIPILTTNYDDLLIKSDLDLFKNNQKEYKNYYDNKFQSLKPFYVNKFVSDVYPINCYYAPNKFENIDKIENQFAIWHIHGMLNYFRSVRIGQNDYFGLSNKLTNKIRQKNTIKTGDVSALSDSWLKMFFSSDILIVGLGLDYSDYVLRWLLNQRFKFQKKQNKELKTFYFYQKGVKQGRRFMFNMLDIDFINVKYKTMYETLPKYLKKIGNKLP